LENDRIYSLEELKENKTLRLVILTHIIVEDATMFVKFIFEKLGKTNLLPHVILNNEF
jgi:hypothetical protein